MPPTQKQKQLMVNQKSSFRDQKFERFTDLTGTVASVSAFSDKALMSLVTRDGPIEITLYSDDEQPTALTPRDGMWRGAILGLAQRALTHQHEVQVVAVGSGTASTHEWIALGITVRRGGA